MKGYHAPFHQVWGEINDVNKSFFSLLAINITSCQGNFAEPQKREITLSKTST